MNWTQDLWERWFLSIAKIADRKKSNLIGLCREDMESTYGEFVEIPTQFALSRGWRIVDRNLNGIIEFERVA